MVVAVAIVEQDAAGPIVAWHEVRCRNPACRALIFRYRITAVVPDFVRVVAVTEMSCPDPRCRRWQGATLLNEPGPLP